MTEITILYDRSETDELGVRQTAEQMDVELGFLPFHKVALSFNDKELSYISLNKSFDETLQTTNVVINRTQAKNRRIQAATIMEVLGKSVLNPLHVEQVCASKLRTLIELSLNGVRVPKTFYTPANVKENRIGVGYQNNQSTISQLIQNQLGDRLVLKPDGGTHGVGVKLAEGTDMLNEYLSNEAPSIINPVGLLAQEYIPKWFFDLRIIVEKEKGRLPYCHPTAMARGGFNDFRTNASLGNMVFRTLLPSKVRSEAVRCASIIGNDQDSYVLALDAMPFIMEEDRVNELELKTYFSDLEKHFEAVNRVKQRSDKKTNFKAFTTAIEDTYGIYMSTKPYLYIEDLINEVVRSSLIYFHEGNSCPEFWENTRIVGGVNVAESIIRCAKSLLDVEDL